MGIVKAVCISDKRGVQKHDAGSARFDPDWGILGDAHGGKWHRQISLLSYEKIEEFNKLGADVNAGAFGENLVVEGLDFRSMPIGTVFKCGNVLLEMTQIGKECHNHCQIYHKTGDCIMPREGVFARVLRGGIISVGDEMAVDESFKPSQKRAAVITVSDKGAKGEREDKSGPRVVDFLEKAGYKVIEHLLIPDELNRIETELKRLSDGRQVHLILTTGGTGFSPRDVTPEATMSVAHRNAPGISEAIRAYSMKITKRAMLSRGASVIRGKTLIMNLPGSPKAVAEALEYILPELEHGIELLAEIASECGANG